MSEYIETANAKVFPSALRVAESSGKFTSENNLTSIIRATTDKHSYVQSCQDAGAGKVNASIVLHGYIFDLNGVTKQDNLFAVIHVNDNGMLCATDDSTSLDSNGKFKGVEFVEELTGFTEQNGEFIKQEDNITQYALQILKNGNVVNTDRVAVSRVGNTDVAGRQQIMYLDKGAPTAGIRIFIQTSTPTSADNPQEGDIWLKI